MVPIKQIVNITNEKVTLTTTKYTHFFIFMVVLLLNSNKSNNKIHVTIFNSLYNCLTIRIVQLYPYNFQFLDLYIKNSWF